MKVYKIQLLLMTAIVSLLSLNSLADPNHIHLDQVASGASDNLNLNIEQIGYDNLIRFSFNHNNNTSVKHNKNKYVREEKNNNQRTLMDLRKTFLKKDNFDLIKDQK